MDSFSLSRPAISLWPRTLPLGLTRQHVQRAVLVAVSLALIFRVSGLATYGFSDDEVAKLHAIDGYRHGEFSRNAEHPMLMKLAMWGSLTFADTWNRVSPPRAVIPQETALRLPNALAGVATVVAVNGVGELLFGPAVGLTAAMVVALDPNITALNRIGKEDTFLQLFFLIAVWCYEYAKRIGRGDWPRAQRFYTLSGAGFGLMLASKYMPHFFGLYLLYQFIYRRHDGGNAPNRPRFYAAMALAFFAANFAILIPATWAYCLGYLRGDGLTHHGFIYGQRLYVSNVPVSADGVPVTYYLRLIATKVPLVILGGAFAGLGPMVRRRRERGFVWLGVLLVLLLVGYSAMAAKFQRYALPMLLLIDILAAVGLVAVVEWLWRQRWDAGRRTVLCGAVYATAIGALFIDVRDVAPFYSLHQNAVGARIEPPVSTFPEEAYDYGMREAIRDIEANAAPGAAIVSDAADIVDYYVAAGARRDLQVRSLSAHGTLAPCEEWVLVQDDHTYFENVTSITRLRLAGTPWREYAMRGVPVLQVFRLAPVSSPRPHAAS